MKRMLLTVMTVLLLSAGAGWAASLEDGEAAYQRGDFATAVMAFRSLAAQGNAKAQNALGTIYLKGQGVVHDDAEAEKWFRLAAAQGFAEAQLNLGALYAKDWR